MYKLSILNTNLYIYNIAFIFAHLVFLSAQSFNNINLNEKIYIIFDLKVLEPTYYVLLARYRKIY